MNEWQVKKFWTEVSIQPVARGYAVRLDGRAIRTPAKAELILPTEKFALYVASEWEAQVEKIDPDNMPATRSANAAIDKVAIQKTEVADMLAAYGDSDLLCYRATSPVELVARQCEIWNPFLDWAAESLGVRLIPREGVVHHPQDPDDIARLSKLVHALSNFELAAFHDLVSLSGSLILGFAVTQKVAPAEEIWLASRLDENWQEQHWGEDADAVSLTAQKRSAFVDAAKIYDAS